MYLILCPRQHKNYVLFTLVQTNNAMNNLQVTKTVKTMKSVDFYITIYNSFSAINAGACITWHTDVQFGRERSIIHSSGAINTFPDNLKQSGYVLVVYEFPGLSP